MSRIGGLGHRLYTGQVSFDFVGRRKLWYSLSAVVLVVSIGTLGLRGLNLGIEFKGGTRIDSMKKLLLENYDAIGAFRAQDAGAAIDPSGELNAAEKFQGPVDLAKLLATKKQEDYTRCLVEKLLTYALGRGLEHYDRTAVKNVADGLAKRKNTFSGLVLEVVNSVPFQKRRGEGDAHAAAK